MLSFETQNWGWGEMEFILCILLIYLLFLVTPWQDKVGYE